MSTCCPMAQMGLKLHVLPFSQFASAPIETDILLNSVECFETDLTILSCSHSMQTRLCSHVFDIVVFCDNGKS